MAKAARDESMEDVLASIRRLVSEETERMPDMRQATSARSAVQPDPDLDVQLGAPDDMDPDFEDAPDPQPALRKSVPQATANPPEAAPRPVPTPRAKLLLTDDYMVEDMERWPDARAAKADAQPDRPATLPPRSQTRSPVARSRRAFDDADQDQVEDDIADFLNEADATSAAKPQMSQETARVGADADDRPSLDERARARSERAERRRQAALRAATIATETAARRASRPAATDPAPQPKTAQPAAAAQPKPAAPQRAEPARAAPTISMAPQAPQPSAPAQRPAPKPVASQPAAPRPVTPAADTQMVPFSMIERAVRASLEQYTADLQPPAPSADAEPEVVLDEETLREMVSDIVRKELQGSLGERITRNVRKLVRREIYRALEARDLG